MHLSRVKRRMIAAIQTTRVKWAVRCINSARPREQQQGEKRGGSVLISGPVHTGWKKKKIWGFFSFLENVSSPCRKKKNFPKKNQRGPSDIFSTRSHNFTRASRTKVDNNKGHIMAQCAFNWCLLSMFKCRVSMILPSLASTRPVCAPGLKT